MRIDWREYKEQSKRVGNQREREQRECRDRWRVRTKRAEKIDCIVSLCFIT